MRPLQYFISYENKGAENRGDAAEGMIGIFQTDRVKMKFNHTALPQEIKLQGVVGQIEVDNTAIKNNYVFCMTAVDGDLLAGRLSDASASVFDQRNLAFGDQSLVVGSLEQFVKKIRTAAQREGWQVRIGMVRYYDKKKHSGMFDKETFGFWKPKLYEYQNEFRVLLSKADAVLSDSYILDIGSIESISGIFPSNSVDVSFIVEHKK